MSNQPILKQLDISAKEVAQFSAKLRNKFIQTLLRWEEYDESIAVLEHLEVERYVTLQDNKIQALLGLGRANEAIELMEHRINQMQSSAASLLLVRCYMADDKLDQALGLATELTQNKEQNNNAWKLLGEIYLQLGQFSRAKTAFIQAQQISPYSRSNIIHLAELYRRQGDLEQAREYASKASMSGGLDGSVGVLSPHHIRALREFYSHIEDIEAVELMNKKLTELFERDLAELRTHWRSEKLKQSYPHGSVLINTMSKPTVNVTKLSDIPTDQRERSEIAEDAAQYLGDASLAEGLSEVIACSRRGECVLAIMPKVYDLSLGYALSVLHEPGLSLVLTAQPDNYKESHKILRKQLGDQISLLYWGIDEQLLWPILQDVAAGRCKLLYASPEWLRYSPFLYALSRADLRRIVIEEADRASAWNNDFEPIYYNFEQIHRDLQLPPILALAQTASPRIREDIERVVFASVIPAENRELSIEPSHATEAKEQTTRPHTVYRQIATDTYRNNVYLRAIEAANDEEKLRHLLELCKRLQGSGIVYTRSRKRCEALADKLREEGIDATYYHAGITNRSEVQTWFTEGRIRIIAATIDFDRSLHKPDLRFIIHYGLPPSLDIYYKEIAPAGRDGQPADCTLIYSRNDQKMLKRKIQDKVIETELLRKTYSALRAMLKQINPNIISLADLGESLGCSTEKFALTLNLLERAELFKRYCNIPQSITLRHIASSDDERFGRFVSTLPLSNNQSELHIDTLELSQITHIHLNLLEGYLLRWQTNGYIEYIPHKYNALLELLPTPENVAERIKYLIEQHEIIQECQLEELMEYATSIHCRHGQISRYLGGKTRYRCSNCDNCQS